MLQSRGARGLRLAEKAAKFRGVRPEHGGRIEMKLAEETPTMARYALSVFSPQGEARADAFIDAETGQPTVDEWQGTPPPAWLETLTRALLRTLARNRNSDGDWPRRITRWRPEPRS
jgi:hypothetical protein